MKIRRKFQTSVALVLICLAPYMAISVLAKWLRSEEDARQLKSREVAKAEAHGYVDRFLNLLEVALSEENTCAAALRDRAGSPLLFAGADSGALVNLIHQINIDGAIWAELGQPLFLENKNLRVREMVFVPSSEGKRRSRIRGVEEVGGFLRFSFSVSDSLDFDRIQRFLPVSARITTTTRRLRSCQTQPKEKNVLLAEEAARCSAAVCPPNPAHCFEVRRISDFTEKNGVRCACELSCLRRAAKSEARRKYKGLAP